MKDSIDYSQQYATAMDYEQCSEKTCGTCFENSGYIYEQYLFAALLNMEKSQLESSRYKTVQPPIKEHSIIAAPVAA